METINDYTRYTTLMRNGFYDKLFFVDKLFGEWESLVDFGCADGFLTKLIAEIFPDKEIIGYDSDSGMVSRQLYTSSNPENVRFTDKLEAIRGADVINLCSVLHEVYSYSDKAQIDEFWDVVFSAGKYVVVRDMVYGGHDGALDTTDIAGYAYKVKEYATNHGFLGELKRFEEIYGSIKFSAKNLAHFLLKYSYVSHPNWERELNENYMGVSYGEIGGRIPKDWEILNSEFYSLPYLKHTWKKDFGEIPNIKTHAKLIIQRK